ncbi:hypothetical protein FDP41_008983 [Naegleria fowleri]|uniref:Protein kinase domain-containing protein n=1 Tax=Naegleria fowleri TaxID=5763 RepID=A0A6A5BFB2_NAEFO|nr:uncharacterized protein FDP41_008983 [Naegleria fowleri]KAF0972734.1 hypothetical protein FDP41_008983 [Naegleria fowleri]CAG4712108.1 unnamed protein product [Naegleria fowleri]
MSQHLEQKRRQKQIQDAIDKYQTSLKTQQLDIDKEAKALFDLVKFLTRFEDNKLAFDSRGNLIRDFLIKHYDAHICDGMGEFPHELYSNQMIWDMWLIFSECYTDDPITNLQALLRFAPTYPKLYETWALLCRKSGLLEEEAAVYEEARTREVVYTELLSNMEKEYIEHMSSQQVQVQPQSQPQSQQQTRVVETPQTSHRKMVQASPTLNCAGYDKNLVFNGVQEYTFEELRAMHYLQTTSLIVNHTERMVSEEKTLNTTTNPSTTEPSVKSSLSTQIISQKKADEADEFSFDFACDITRQIPTRKSIVEATPTSYAYTTIDSMFRGEIDSELENNYFEQRKLRKAQEGALDEKKRKRDNSHSCQDDEYGMNDTLKKAKSTTTNTSRQLLPKPVIKQPTEKQIQAHRNRSLSAFHQFNKENDESGIMYFEEDENNLSKTIIISRDEAYKYDVKNVPEQLKKLVSNGVINPFSEDTRKIYSNIVNLSNCFNDSRVSNCKGTSLTDISSILNELAQKKKNKDNYNSQMLSLKLNTKTYLIEDKLSSHVIQIQDLRNNNGINHRSFALKFRPPNDFYEYYMVEELQRRIPEADSHRFPNIQRVYVFDKNTLLMEKLVNNITLQRAMDSGTKLEETIILYYTLELLNILQSLHNKANMIHNSILPSNLLLLNEDGAELSDWAINGKGWNTKGLMLTDFSKALNLELFPSHVKFSCAANPKTLPQVFTNVSRHPSSWKYSADTWSVCYILHQLLFKNDMEVLTKQDQYHIKESIRRYWKFKDIWQYLFENLLNQDQRHPNEKPDYSPMISMCQQALGSSGDTVKALFLRFIVSLSSK